MNSLYDSGRQKFLDGIVSWSDDDIKIVLIDTNHYSVDLQNHEFLSDISTQAKVATSNNLSSKTSTAGVADADDIALSSVIGETAEAIVIYKDAGAENTSPLIAYIDTATGLPVAPDFTEINIIWGNGPSKIFKL